MTRPLRILCFGDSLTAGYSLYGTLYTPYHESLSRRLTTIFPGLELAIEEDGENGGMTKDYRTRLLAQYRKTGAYDWIIVLGGTNDLAMGVLPEGIFENLERTWTLARLKKTKVLALTVPDIANTTVSKAFSRISSCRDHLNELIIGYTATNVHSFDFKSAFAYGDMSRDDQRRFWDDAVHLTPAGYDRMGELVANALAEILRKEDDGAAGAQKTTLSTVRPNKRRRMFKDDELSFEEEDGKGTPAQTSGDELRRGYVVVRRKDLD
ncbi:gdsl-like lipase acylhydrolase [Ophiostoma piceae UAMH 11346]|uniref:Gdsl-like lipase acylhydrolase n=1 Tax=Ophiostoma piceae (strain UAMH 11346) TaxID=1262450 RepID=S3BMP2_OPHP1|nr:gdsl-like lipase acylhydrolase [Ophiostoma piceae UAMH 11346]